MGEGDREQESRATRVQSGQNEVSVCLWDSKNRRENMRKKDVFEQDVDMKKITRFLDLVPQTVRPLKQSAMV